MGRQGRAQRKLEAASVQQVRQRSNVAGDHGVCPDGAGEKHATPEAASVREVNGEAFAGTVRPHVLSSDYNSSQAHDVDVQEIVQLAKLTTRATVQTGQSFWDQWQNRFVSWEYPFSLPAPVGGPDFPSKSRDRGSEAAVLAPFAHMQPLARRVESSIRNSWDLVPGCAASR